MINFPNLTFGNNNTHKLSIPMNNFFMESNWMSVYKPISETLNNKKTEERKMNIVFQTQRGKKVNIIIDIEKTISDLIKMFFERIGKPEYFHNQREYYFIYNAQVLNYNDSREVGKIFQFYRNPKIYANSVKDLIGA